MSNTDGETLMREKANDAIYDRLANAKNEIADLTDQITDVLNTLAGATKQQARRRYKQARANVDSAVDDLSERSGAMMNAAQEAAATIEETLEDVIVQRPLAIVGLALGVGFLIGVTWRR